MEGFVQQVFIQELPFDVPLEKALDQGMKYLYTEIPRVTKWLEVIFTPPRQYLTHQIFIFSDGKDAFIGFLVSQKATFLVDPVSEIIQLYGGINVTDETIMLTFIQRWIHDFIMIFIELCSIRLTISLWLTINPYTFPWFILVTATEWFTESLSGIFPAFFGIEITSTVLLSILASFADYIKNLVFTMPYLPSERVAETIGKHEVYRFGGIPKLWYEYGIPDQLREEWYRERPDIIQNLIKYYGNVGVDFVPSRILEQYYNHLYKSQINPANLTSSVTDFVSTNTLSYDLDIHHYIHHFF
jgi:hypothetical protein